MFSPHAGGIHRDHGHTGAFPAQLLHSPCPSSPVHKTPSDACARTKIHRDKRDTSILPRTQVHELLLSFRHNLIETS